MLGNSVPHAWAQGKPPKTTSRAKTRQSRQRTPGGDVLLLRAEHLRKVGRLTIAEGNVSVNVSGIRLDCQYLEYDPDTGLVKGKSEVVFFWGENYAAADTIELDTRTRGAVLRQVAGQAMDLGTSSKLVEQPLYFWADEMRWTPTKAQLFGATLTTCDKLPGEWHYKLQARQIDIYPHDHLDAYATSLSVGKQRVIYVPSLTLSLNSQRELWQDFLPTGGYSSVFGAYIRDSIPFRFDKDNFGKFQLGYYSLGGFAGGFQDQFSLGKQGGGNIYYYKQNGTDAYPGRYDFHGSLGYRLDKYTSLGISYSDNLYALPGYVSPKNTSFSVQLSRNTPGNTFQIGASLSTEGSNSNGYYHAYYQGELDERTTATLSGDFTTASTSFTSTQRYHFLASLLRREDIVDVTGTFEDTNGQDTFFTNRNPEIQARFHPFYLGPVPFLFNAAVGNIEESPEYTRTDRIDTSIAIPDQSLDLLGGKFSAGAGYRQLFYGTGDAESITTARSSFTENINSFSTGRIDLNVQLPSGTTPFAQDYYYSYATLTGGLELYKTGAFKFSAFGGWDLQHNTPSDAIGRMDLTPDPRWSVSVGSNYDLGNGKFRSLDTLLNFKLLKNVSVSYWNVYDFEVGKVDYRDFLVNLESHDWDASIAYRGLQNLVFFQFSLKAFPQPKVNIGPNPISPVMPLNLPNAFVR
jgi:hypothetical protein